MNTRKTKIVCTIGPASEKRETMSRMIDAGMNVIRLNFSHGDHQEHGARIVLAKELREEKNANLAILLDTKGPEIRTHDMAEKFILEKGAKLKISMTEVLGTPEMISISYPELINDVNVGDSILIDDGKVGLTVDAIDKAQGIIDTTVQNTGPVSSKKGINVPGVSTKLPAITAKDEADIRFGCQQGVDYIAQSFVRRAEDVIAVREILKQEGAEHIQIIPKIECQEAVDNIESIIEVSDGLMIARGDLGIEVPAEEVPILQKHFIRLCNLAGKPVITATQMLDSMQDNPRPTRAEVSDVANAIYDGTDAIMLSGESANGSYPVETVETMSRIAFRAEEEQDYKAVLSRRAKYFTETKDINDAIGLAVGHTALNLDIETIATSTQTGRTARLISKYRPHAHIVAVTPNQQVSRSLAIVWGVTPIVGGVTETTDEMVAAVNAVVKVSGAAKKDDTIIITAGTPIAKTGNTNTMKIHIIE